MNTILVLQHIACEGPGIFADILRTKDKFRLQYLKLYKDNYKSIDINKYDALIILGGPMNVDEVDKYPFLEWEISLIREAEKRNLPILGVCLGAQLIAKAFGARVYKGLSREVGWHKVQITDKGKCDKIFSMFPDEFKVFQLHSDTFDIPRRAVRLAESLLCKNQAFRIKENVYGLQFHLEVTRDMLSDWTKTYKKELTPHELDDILMSSDKNLTELASLARLFIGILT